MNPKAQRRAPRKATRSLCLGLLMIGLAVEPGHAWRETGHFAVCEIAYRNLTQETREQVDALLNGRDFATQCTWPDMVRKSERWGHTYDWHFINLDDGLEYFAAGNVNPKGDVLQALLLAEAKLLDQATPDSEKRIYLRFLAHFAGDSHQPLHIGLKSDLGGNLITVSWFGDDTFESTAIELAPHDAGSCTGEGISIHPATGECVRREVSRRPVNLHKVWDLLMLQRFIHKQRLRAEAGDSEFLHKAYATAVKGMLDRDEIARANQGTFWDWTAESLRDRGRAYAIGRGKLKRRYYRRNIGYLNRRIASAGHRLAFTLNRIFAATKTPEATAIEQKHRALRERIIQLAGDGSPLAGAPAVALASAPTGDPAVAETLPHELRWVRDSAEYRAILIQTYRFAAEVLAARAADLEPGSWAVSVDADETLIDNSQYQKERASIGEDYDSESWAEWVSRRQATPLPGALGFLARVRELGGKIAIVTNRKHAECPDTEANISALSMPYDVILCRRDDRRKEARWQQIEDGTASPNLPPLDIVMWLGDNIHDFPHLEQELRHQPEAVHERFGIEYFVLPNPMYGSWDD